MCESFNVLFESRTKKLRSRDSSVNLPTPEAERNLIADSVKLDPFTEEATLIVRCDVVEPSTLQGYERDPRSVAKRAE